MSLCVRNCVTHSRRQGLEKKHLYYMWVKITFPFSKGILLGTIYKQPDNDRHHQLVQIDEKKTR